MTEPCYEIRLRRSDGELSIVMKVSEANDTSAKQRAWDMLAEDLTNADIWKNGRLVASLYRLH